MTNPSASFKSKLYRLKKLFCQYCYTLPHRLYNVELNVYNEMLGDLITCRPKFPA